MECYEYHKDQVRNGESCKNKFEKIAFMNEPTGTIEILLNVLRAKELKEKNSSKKVIGFCEENNSDFEYFNQEENLNNLSYKKL